MDKGQIEVGRKYAIREKVSVGEPLLQVQVLEIRHGGQIKVRRLSEPNAGLEEVVKTRQFLVPWGERRAFLKDEECARRFASARTRANQALVGAIRTVICATGYNDAWAEDDGTVHMEADELREVARLAGLLPNIEALHEAAYVDRGGEMHLPVEVAEKLAHAYAVAEPEIVLMYIEDEESGLKAKGYEPGQRYYHDILREQTPGFALARYWAGHEREVAQLRGEIERMRELVKSAAVVLEKAGQEREGWRLRRALDGG
jgi:hypothetical protein